MEDVLIILQTKSLATELFQVNHIRNKHHINVHGASPPDLIETFDQLINDCGIPQQIVNNLISCGYKEPTPIQMQAIPIMTSVSLLASSFGFIPNIHQK